MAQWIYVSPSTSDNIGSLSSWSYGYSTITGYPFYTSDAGLVLTNDKPASSISIRSGSYNQGIGSLIIDYWGGIKVNAGGSTRTLFDGQLDDSMTNPKGYSYQYAPTKIFRTSGTTAIDKYCTIYEDVTVTGAYRVDNLGTSFKSGMIIPVTYLLNGKIQDGIGNHASSFTFSNSTSSSNGGKGRSYITNNTAMVPAGIIRRSANSNNLNMTTLKVGDILNFGALPQNVPSVLTDWLKNNCTEVTDVADPLVINFDDPDGIQLQTANMFCNWDVKVVPKLETKTITVTGDTTVKTNTSSYVGMKEVKITTLKYNNEMSNRGMATVAITCDSNSSNPIKVKDEAGNLLRTIAIGTTETFEFFSGTVISLDGSDSQYEMPSWTLSNLVGNINFHPDSYWSNNYSGDNEPKLIIAGDASFTLYYYNYD